MTKNYKLIYNQYKHLIDVFTTGDFLIESLDKPVGLITYRKLLTDDNILYFTQNTKRTCKVPIGISKKDESIKRIDLMSRSFKYKHWDEDELNNFRKSVICYLLQNYSPNEYEVYYDFNVDGLDSLDNFHVVANVDELDSIYSSIARERHKKYIESGVYTYKDYRKNNSDKLVIFLLANREFLNRLECICGGHIRYGISIIAIYEDAIADSSTISLQNTVRPNISDEDMRNEIEIYRRMLGVFNNMNGKIDLNRANPISEFSVNSKEFIKIVEEYIGTSVSEYHSVATYNTAITCAEVETINSISNIVQIIRERITTLGKLGLYKPEYKVLLVMSVTQEESDKYSRDLEHIYRLGGGAGFYSIINVLPVEEINLLTGEINNEGDLHEELLVNLPSNDYGYAIYNMRDYGYQFGGVEANGDYGSFYHHLLSNTEYLDEEAIRYLINASVYTLFSHSSVKLRESLASQEDLSSSDRKYLDRYIDDQVTYYRRRSNPGFNLTNFEQYCDLRECNHLVFYETFFCKVELDNKKLVVTINGKKKQLPNYLLFFVDVDSKTISPNLLELLIRYELYLEYGIHIPEGIRALVGIWYIDDRFILEHQPVDTSVENLKDRLNSIGALGKSYEQFSNKDYCEMISSAYSELAEFKIKSYINYWLTRKEDLRKLLPSKKDVVPKNYVIGIMNPNGPEVDEALATTLMINGSRVVIMGDGESFGTVLDGTLNVISELGCNNYSEDVISTIVEQLICSAVEGVVLSSSDKEKIREYAMRQVSLKSTLKKSTSF